MMNFNYSVVFLFVLLVLLGCKSDEDEIPKDCSGITWTHNESENGQDRWVHLCSGFSSCGGDHQSPVDITGALPNLELFDLNFYYATTSTEIINNGNTVEFACEEGSELVIGTETYQLLQFHFHANSEHQIDGNYFPLEVHFVHQASETNLAVVAVLFEEGEENEFFSEFLQFFPSDGEIFTDTIEFNPGELLPENLSYYHYQGSLTTPPCSEVVNWYILKNTISASAAQLAHIAVILDNNYRKIQPLNNRSIYSKED